MSQRSIEEDDAASDYEHQALRIEQLEADVATLRADLSKHRLVIVDLGTENERLRADLAALTQDVTNLHNIIRRSDTEETARLRADLAAANQKLDGAVMKSQLWDALKADVNSRDQIDQTFDAVRLAGWMADREAAARARYRASHDQDARPDAEHGGQK